MNIIFPSSNRLKSGKKRQFMEATALCWPQSLDFNVSKNIDFSLI